ncbi:MAG: PepSY domain-containing protein [Bacteroidales bacterium]|nr:PepSY domain-containing protein [Bacteroidales bacterium]
MKKSLSRKIHKWPALFISFFLLYYGVTGILMNHRELISGCDIGAGLMPPEYRYSNWNNAAIKGGLIYGSDSLLLFGNIGVWLTDSAYSGFVEMNAGFPEGTDNHKIFDLHRADDGEMYAATLFGLFSWDSENERWVLFDLGPETKTRFTAIESAGDTLYATDRSNLYVARSEGPATRFEKTEIAAPEGYKNDITLFETIWQIHSGEILGLPGKLFVDFLGMITIFLSLTGIIYFFFPRIIKRRARKNQDVSRLAGVNRWSLRWHNLTGELTFVLLGLLFLTGMFLRPPLLIAIAEIRTAPVRFSHLDQPNPWYDRLRDILYDDDNDRFLLATSEGIFSMNRDDMLPVRFPSQPPVSVMGINTFEKLEDESFLAGSFSGLFRWDPLNGTVNDFIDGSPYAGNQGGRPVGEFLVTGAFRDFKGRLVAADYNTGLAAIGHEADLPVMPASMSDEQKISLWNLALEFHTGRIFQTFTGGFYILIVPLAGLTAIAVVISGYLILRRRRQKRSGTGKAETHH